MKKFKFTLQAVHGVRETRQEQEQLVLSRLQAAAEAEAARIVEIENRRLTALEVYARRLECGEQIDPLEMQLSVKYLTSLDTLALEAKQILKQKQTACEQQSKTLAVAAQAVKATANIRETQRARHHLETARVEQIALDEMVSINYTRALCAEY